MPSLWQLLFAVFCLFVCLFVYHAYCGMIVHVFPFMVWSKMRPSCLSLCLKRQ